MMPLIFTHQYFDYSEYEKELAAFERSLTPVEKKAFGTSGVKKSRHGNKKFTAFKFNPNTVCVNDLEKLGFSERVIQNIIKYRTKGGVFYKKSDLLKIYGMDTSLYCSLNTYIYPDEHVTKKQREKINSSNITDKDSSVLIDINNTDTHPLCELPGIERLLPEKIIRYRDLLGGYYSNTQFKEIPGIQDEQFKLLINKVFIDTASINKININKTDERTLEKHPYLNKYYSKAILKYRNFTGMIVHINELLNNKILPEDIFYKIRPYLAAD